MRQALASMLVVLPLFGVAAAADPPPQAVPGTRELARSVAQYVERYQREFVRLVADEHTIQEVRDGERVLDRREARGELFSTFLERDGTWMSAHEITEVDGQPIAAGQGARALLARESFGVAARQLADANARYNIGRVARNFNEPTLALLAFTPKHIDQVAFDRGSVDRTDPTMPLVTLTFRGRDGSSIVRSASGRRVTMRGSAVVEPDTGRVRWTSVTIADGVVTATLDTTYALDANVGLWVPTVFTERYDAPRMREVTTVRTTLSNYRRFDVTIKILQ